ncbi:MAG: chloride channel protein, partial [Rhodospirillales bacterium]|nr:chloride channel protein [Rhodospirillales bacterium]
MSMPIFTPSRFLMYARRVVRNDQLILSVLALFIGVAGGGAVIVFREGITLIQTAFYGSGTESLFKHAQELPWWQLLLAPAAGGLVVGGLVHFFMPGRRPQGVADVIEASALKGGRMSLRSGIKAAVVSAASIGAGASVGREGPAVHLGASIAGWTAKRLHLTRSLSRVLLGCGVAAAVSGSFNAPIAGALFANEVVIGHYALSAFAPVVIASVTGTAISRIWFGDFPAFIIPEHTIASFLELPIFAGLGIVCAVVSIVLMKGIVLSETLAKKTRLPIGLRPAVAGLIVGAIATIFPQVLGIGYGATEAALELSFPLMLFIAMVAAKLIATAVSLGFGFGGGIFSPSLVIGAMLGSAYGLIVTQAMPGISSGADAYSIVGMGAVAAAVLGAPISTTLIIFEMTGDYALTLGVMIAVVVATVITQQSLGHSFFTLQLERRGLDLKGGYAATLLRM